MPEKDPPSATAGEKREAGFRRVDLEVVAPDSIHRLWGVAYTGTRESDCVVYNGAIDRLATERGWNPFHQSGVTNKGSNTPGWHYWEFWTDGVNGEVLKGDFVPAVHERAETDYARWGYEAYDEDEEALPADEWEGFEAVDLRVHLPGASHTWGLEFESEKPRACVLYIRAIREIAEDEDITVFWQNASGDDEPGWHMIEFAGHNNEDADFWLRLEEDVIPKVHNQAGRLYEETKDSDK